MQKLSIRDLIFIVTISAMAVVVFQQNHEIQYLTNSNREDSIRLELFAQELSVMKVDLRESESHLASVLRARRFELQLSLQGAMHFIDGNEELASESYRMLDKIMPENISLLKINWLTNDRLKNYEAANSYLRKYKIAVAENATGLNYDE